MPFRYFWTYYNYVYFPWVGVILAILGKHNEQIIFFTRQLTFVWIDKYIKLHRESFISKIFLFNNHLYASPLIYNFFAIYLRFFEQQYVINMIWFFNIKSSSVENLEKFLFKVVIHHVLNVAYLFHLLVSYLDE